MKVTLLSSQTEELWPREEKSLMRNWFALILLLLWSAVLSWKSHQVENWKNKHGRWKVLGQVKNIRTFKAWRWRKTFPPMLHVWEWKVFFIVSAFPKQEKIDDLNFVKKLFSVSHHVDNFFPSSNVDFCSSSWRREKEMWRGRKGRYMTVIKTGYNRCAHFYMQTFVWQTSPGTIVKFRGGGGEEEEAVSEHSKIALTWRTSKRHACSTLANEMCLHRFQLKNKWLQLRDYSSGWWIKQSWFKGFHRKVVIRTAVVLERFCSQEKKKTFVSFLVSTILFDVYRKNKNPKNLLISFKLFLVISLLAAN